MSTIVRRGVSALCIVAAATAICGEARAEGNFKVQTIEIGRQGDKLRVEMVVNARDIKPGRDREVVFTPVVRSIEGADSVELPTIKICGRNRYYSHLRNDDLLDGEAIFEAGSDSKIDYHPSVHFENWMSHSRIVMREEVANCCDMPVPDGETPIAEIDLTPRPFVPEFEYVALTGDSTVTRTAEGEAFVDFVVNRTEIKPDYRDNRNEIAKILNTIDVVKSDPDAVITRITIKGYASPEGPYDNNVRLAIGRTAALKEYVRAQYDFPQEIMWTDYEPEDWAGFRRRILATELPHRDEIVQIIDSEMAPDPKDHFIKKSYPEEYAEILRDIYPALRHSDYTVKYNIRTFVDIEELKAVFAKEPSKLRPVDFSRIAATYPTGSKEYCDVYMKAVEVYPNDEQANVNAANILMARGDYAAAARCTAKAGDTPEAIYTRGVLAAVNGDGERAKSYLERARELGVTAAEAALNQLDEIANRETVTYLITPTE